MTARITSEELHLISWTRGRCQDGTARSIRQGAGLSLAEAGAHLSVSLSTVSKWETGNRLPRTDFAIAYGRFLHALIRR